MLSIFLLKVLHSCLRIKILETVMEENVNAEHIVDDSQINSSNWRLDFNLSSVHLVLLKYLFYHQRF